MMYQHLQSCRTIDHMHVRISLSHLSFRSPKATRRGWKNREHTKVGLTVRFFTTIIDLLAILQKGLDRALFLYNFMRDARSSGVRCSITIMHIRKFFKLHHNIVRFRVFPRIAKRSINLRRISTFSKAHG